MKDANDEKVIAAALVAREKAYAPYSNYRVGAALLGQNDRIYTGCNIENASFGATICAERVAAVKAVSEGETKFLLLVVATASQPPAFPCGICRQFLAEFGMDLKIILVNPLGDRVETTLADCLPGAFGPHQLKQL